MRRWLPWVAVAALLLWQKSCADRNAGALQAEIRASHEREQQLAERGVRLDTVYVSQKVAVVTWRTRYDTLVKNLPETLIVAPPIKAILTAADSTIHACSAALLTCEQRVSVRDSLIVNLRNQLRLEKKRRPGLFAQLGRSAALLGAGFVAAKVLAR